jgi:hypothetical protein
MEKMLDDMRQTGKKFGRDFWYGEDIRNFLNDVNRATFNDIIGKAKRFLLQQKINPDKHFESYSKTITTANGKTQITDWALSRLACLCVAKTSFRSGRSALLENYFMGENKTFEQFMEDKGRMILRPMIKGHHKLLARADARMGAESGLEYALLGQETTRAIYEMDTPELQEYRNLAGENIYDHMTKAELCINDGVIMETNEKLREFRPFSGFDLARETHRAVGHSTRMEIELANETLPEYLPVAEKTPRQLLADEKRVIRELTKL